MWSFGCLLYELYTGNLLNLPGCKVLGQPIFPGESEQDQFLCMMEVLGIPESDLILVLMKCVSYLNVNRGLQRKSNSLMMNLNQKSFKIPKEKCVCLAQ